MPKLRHHYRFDAIGAPWDIETPHALSADTKQRISEAIEGYDHIYSRFRSDSMVTRLAGEGGNVELPHAAAIFALYDDLYAATDGAVTPMVGQALSDLGYDADYSLRPGRVSAVPDYHETLRYEGDTVMLAQPALLDIGAAGKGRLVDLVTEIVAGEMADYVIDGSGDIAVGDISARIGLEHPGDPTIAIGHVDVAGGSVCGSAPNRRAWGDGLHHIIDARTGKPTADVLATWAIADTAMLADGLATALFFAQPEKLREAFDFAYVVMHADGSVTYSRDNRITLYD